MRCGHGTAKNREILRIHIDHAPVDRAPTRYNTVTGWLLVFHAKISATVRDEHVIFFKTLLIEQQLDPLTRAQFAFCKLAIEALLTAAKSCSTAALGEFLQNIFHCMSLLCAAVARILSQFVSAPVQQVVSAGEYPVQVQKKSELSQICKQLLIFELQIAKLLTKCVATSFRFAGFVAVANLSFALQQRHERLLLRASSR